MPISKEQVAHIARLARLTLTPEDLDRYTQELTQIVAYFDRLAAVDTGGVEIRSGGRAAGPVFREDKIYPSLSVDDVLRNAPEKKDTFLIVPRVI